MIEWGALGKAVFAPVSGFFKEHLGFLSLKRHKLASEELTRLANTLEALTKQFHEASVKAQLAVRGSHNEGASVHQDKAIELSTSACQEFATLIYNGEMASKVPPTLRSARVEYRKLVADENNVAISGADEREARCEAIEAATATLCTEMHAYCFREYGIGLGRKAGRIRNRTLPD